MRILMVLLLLVSFGVIAEEGNKEKRFEERKAHAIANIEERIAGLEKAKSCISSATDGKAIKECRKTLREENENRRKKNKAEHEKRRSDRKAKREARKNK